MTPILQALLIAAGFVGLAAAVVGVRLYRTRRQTRRIVARVMAGAAETPRGVLRRAA